MRLKRALIQNIGAVATTNPRISADSDPADLILTSAELFAARVKRLREKMPVFRKKAALSG